jgi:hypothetical protein
MIGKGGKGNPRDVAKKVLKQIQNGELPNKKKAMIEVGYSLSTASRKQKEISERKDYKKVMESFADRIDICIDEAISGLIEKKEEANYRDFSNSIQGLVKTSRLIRGESTENNALNISSILDNLEKEL